MGCRKLSGFLEIAYNRGWVSDFFVTEASDQGFIFGSEILSSGLGFAYILSKRIFSFMFSETEFHYVALAGLELTMWISTELQLSCLLPPMELDSQA